MLFADEDEQWPLGGEADQDLVLRMRAGRHGRWAEGDGGGGGSRVAQPAASAWAAAAARAAAQAAGRVRARGHFSVWNPSVAAVSLGLGSTEVFFYNNDSFADLVRRRGGICV
jgi:hypothetical protein